ncbi:MAG: hypothetical protein JJT82_03595 [Legionellaceae bacterium]|nr:hypothetical protein [Legionellaceae bacterium]
MTRKDEALNMPNARLLSAVYFGLLAVVATIIIDTLLYLMGVGELIPTFKAVVLATLIAVIAGAIFGKKIIYSKRPYQKTAFKWGFLMVLVALPFYDFGFMWVIQHHHPESFSTASLANWLLLYVILLVYSFVLAGFWLAIAAGFAAIYLRGRLVYDIMHSEENEVELSARRKKSKAKPLGKPRIKHP